MRHGVRISNLDGSVRGDGAKQGADDTLLLIVAADEGVADVEEHSRVELSDHAGVARRHVENSPSHGHGEYRSVVVMVVSGALRQSLLAGAGTCESKEGDSAMAMPWRKQRDDSLT